MTVEELTAMLTEGLDEAQAAPVRAAIQRDAVKNKVVTIKAQSEYQDLVTREANLKAELDGGPDKPGAKAYAAWYSENFPKVQQLQTERAAYEAKFGKLEGGAPPPGTPPAGGKTYTDEDIQRIVDARIGGTYAPQWSTLLTGTGTIVQKHMFAGRKKPIDFAKLAELAPKYGGNLEQAYDEWDKPDREAAEKLATEAEIDKRVKEELQKRGTQTSFPGSVESGPSSLSVRTKADVDKFDPAAMRNDLLTTWNTAGMEKQ